MLRKVAAEMVETQGRLPYLVDAAFEIAPILSRQTRATQ